jgi:subfamily B ATP-binding cassette protein MsbA
VSVLRLLPPVYRLLGPHRRLFWLTVLVSLVTALWSVVTFLSASVLLQGFADVAGIPGLGFGDGSLLGAGARLLGEMSGPRRVMLGFAATVGSMIVSGLLGLGTLALGTRFLARFVVRLQTLCFDRVVAYRMDFHDETRRSQLNQLIIVEARACYSLLKELTTVVGNGFQVLVHGALLLLVSPLLTGLALVVGVAAWAALGRLNRLNRRWAKVALKRRNDVMAVTHETLYGIKQVKLLGAGARLSAEFQAAADDSARLFGRAGLLVNGQSTVMQVFGLLAVLLVIGVAVTHPEIVPAGRVLLFLFIATGTIPALAGSVREYGIMIEQVEAVQAVVRFLAQDAALEVDGQVERPVLCRDRVVFDRVTLDYESRKGVLRDVSLEIRRGERVGIVGASGSGKTSLVNLIPRLYDPREGAVRIDDTDVRDFRLAFLRRRVGVLSQDVFVFNASVAENIRMGRPEASHEDVVAAARLAYAHDFIASLPDGYDTVVGDRGVKLSGGQRQRINIAQVFLKDPEILVLDEATSALDSESEALVQDAIKRLSADRTVVIVAHRLSTLRDVDRLVVLEGGVVVEQGTWDELLRRGGAFARMWEVQAGAIG